MRARIWLTWFISQVEEDMSRFIRPAPIIAVALVVAACGSTSAPSPAAVASASPVATASPRPVIASASVPAATPSGSPTAFASKLYGYSVTVPAGWSTVQAMLAWDGKGAPSHDVAEADQFVSPGPASAWLLSAPTENDLSAQVQQAIEGNRADHGDTCPPVPASQDPITIGGGPGVLLSYDCGILINVGVAVHRGKAYVFGFRDPAVHAATDPTDRATFISLLESVKFPG
jgi:hypothetical protein